MSSLLFQFMYLTVPLPIAQHREIRLHLIPRDPELPPVRVRLLVPQNASFMQVKEKLGTMVKCKASNVCPPRPFLRYDVYQLTDSASRLRLMEERRLCLV
jgi:hypothetical protein